LRCPRLRCHVGRARSGLRLFRLGPVRPTRPQSSVDGLRGRGPGDHRDHGLSRARFLGARTRLLYDGRVPRARGIRPLSAPFQWRPFSHLLQWRYSTSSPSGS
jgi:hypothetical protein